jgi:predicted lipoprotein with Yx(FWY)xxD motif
VKTTLFGAASVAAVLAIAGCGGGGSGSGSAPAPPSGAKGASATPGITIAHAKLGSYLADSKGRALYLFEADKGSASSCYSACASVWPPLTSGAAVTPGSGVMGALVGTSKRSDGTSEVTYHGHPLYYYAGDQTAGSITGEGLNQFGAKWYLVAPSGIKIDNDGH